MVYRLQEDDSITIICNYLKINRLGICFCKVKGKQKLKNQNIIGTCYLRYIADGNTLPNYKIFRKNKLLWAVQHLQYENNPSVVNLAKAIVKGEIDL